MTVLPDALVPFRFTLIPAHKPPELHENIRSSVARNLPVVSLCAPHEGVLTIAGGGPSLADTLDDLDGYVAAMNGSLGFLLDRGIVPQMCGVCDPSPHIADILAADPRVTYFVASSAHPTVFDKLLAAGCRVYRWNCSSIPGAEKLLDQIEPGHLIVGGGSTMGLRWLTLGYTMGFRRFRLHGMDSSFRVAEGSRSSHAYPDHQDGKEWIVFEGHHTRPNFIGQVVDFVGWLERLTHPDVEPIDLQVFGDGLLQKKFREWKALNPGMHEGRPKPPLDTDTFVWPASDALAAPAIREDAKDIPRFMAHIHDRRIAVQAGGNVGIYAAHLARYFAAVHTFEPDPENYACLIRNIEGRGRIAAHHAALGAIRGMAAVERFEDHNAGAVRVVPGDAVPMCRIDDLDLPACDLIWLDIEGYEPAALAGAEKTIARYRPAVIVEEGRHAAMYGFASDAARAWLEARGYEARVRHGNDTLFVAERVNDAMAAMERAALPKAEFDPSRTALTVAAVQVGNYCGRGAEYVAKLFRGVAANLPAGIVPRFVCFTDDPATLPDGVEAMPVEPGLTGWWQKLAMFRPGTFAPGERVLFLDLDTLIAGPLDEIATYAGPFAIMRDVYRPNGLQSSVMAWEAGGAAERIWTTFDASGRPMDDPGGDQRWIERAMPDVDCWQDVCPGRFVSFKKDCRPFGGIPAGASVIVFHGQPRPHLAAEPWIARLWAA